MQEISKTYTASEWEDKLYKRWEESGYFNPDKLIEDNIIAPDAEPFSILMPPPNVTGVLHLGHAMENALMDTTARYKRMQGFRTLFLPGADHAAVATQARVEKNLVSEGHTNPRQEFGREKLLEIIRQYADNSKQTIIKQIRKVGSSCDWSRFAYTFDATRGKAVNEVFKKMYDDGLIYRGYRVINWSVKGQSTCSDDELVHIERAAKFYTFRYAKDFPIPISTTRPETKLGDTAVAVHPNDNRYKQFIGQTFSVDVKSQSPLTIKIIGDENVDPQFGTGAVGLTPAHSLVDFEMYERHGDIELIQVIGSDGRMTDNAGLDYAGLTIIEAREKFVLYLEQSGLLEKVEDITQNVGTSDRFGDIVEAIPMNQWFVNVNKTIPGRDKSLKNLMREAITTGLNGDVTQKVSIQPDRFAKIYLHWIDNLRDWCISRQVWWGHRIPIWYKNGEIYSGIEAPKEDGWEQDTDTLDTWFSSGLWTFSTLGWPEDTKDFKYFHPISWMQMGSDILFFWMARMILMTTYTLQTIPFQKVYLHGMLHDKDGNKFSKSLGNGIDPIDVISQYGTDALRISLLSDITPGNNIRFYFEKVEVGRNLVNKLWNIGRYIMTQSNATEAKPKAISNADHWICLHLDQIVHEVTGHLDNYNFSMAGETLRDFTWNDFADWYVEIHKIEKNDALLRYVFETILKLWHPFMPFVTEALWQQLHTEKSLLMIEKWPKDIARITNVSGIAAAGFGHNTQPLITAIRNIRATYHIDPIKKVTITLITPSREFLDSQTEIIQKLARVEAIHILTDGSDAPSQCAYTLIRDIKLYVHLEGILDVDKEKTRLQKELEQTKKYAQRITAQLSNPNFVNQAPEAIIMKNKEELLKAKMKTEEITNHLKNLL